MNWANIIELILSTAVTTWIVNSVSTAKLATRIPRGSRLARIVHLLHGITEVIDPEKDSKS
jgi:hypothetical protein